MLYILNGRPLLMTYIDLSKYVTFMILATKTESITLYYANVYDF